jgi:hypothetical protein
MLDTIPLEFWSSPNKVFEPCCGKGNFVLGIFDRFYTGLEAKYPDNIERCKVIMTQCIYYADLTALNVFITTELLKCHVQNYYYCAGAELDIDYSFNNYTGDTLKIDITKQWKITGFDAVIGNPPYNDSQNNIGKKGGGDLLWNKFVEKSLKNWLLINGYLLYVHPPGWRKPESPLSKYNGLFNLMTKTNQMIYLEIYDTKDGLKTFKCGTRYDWYLIEKKQTYKNTTVISQTRKLYNIDLSDWNFLPNDMYDIVYKLLKTKYEDECKIIQSMSSYETRKKWISYNY